MTHTKMKKELVKEFDATNYPAEPKEGKDFHLEDLIDKAVKHALNAVKLEKEDPIKVTEYIKRHGNKIPGYELIDKPRNYNQAVDELNKKIEEYLNET